MGAHILSHEFFFAEIAWDLKKDTCIFFVIIEIASHNNGFAITLKFIAGTGAKKVSLHRFPQ
jgi:hypothetical protein